MASVAAQRLLSSRTYLSARSATRFSPARYATSYAQPRPAAAAKFTTTTTAKPANDSNPAQSKPAETATRPPTDLSAASPLPEILGSDGTTDWSRSYSGLSQQPFPKEVADVLLAPIDPDDVEVKPDGLLYLPEIKYRRVLNRAFGPGGWGLAPRSETNVGPKIVSREYALVCFGRLVAVARGEQEYFDPSGVATATEACKSNALMRCCKDLGVASELWDPRFIRNFKERYCMEVFAEHVPTKKKKKLWRRKDQGKFGYPFQE
ncbi:unnamed protein product [Cyclocybe aegerita]|uniref:Mitochondrial genome maintenance protein MGM101 n=1 Tax=Cyclocybe aegerita TaxID=1973307 RepID=A0A8S0VSR7_CYCAE|nr:unnamed protein product [Cyclocybe aegerita]